MENESQLTIYGTTSSQPVRSVLWVCLIKGVDFHFRYVEYSGYRSDELLQLNPRGQIPTIKDGDFSLYEMPAILAYLAEKYDWHDLYPKDTLQRACIHQYLHMHHTLTREATWQLMAPHVTVAILEVLKQFGATELAARAENPDKLQTGQNVVSGIADVLEQGYFRDTLYLCSDKLSIADFACYEELWQLQCAQLFDFSNYPKLNRWLDSMSQLPFHSDIHCYNASLGDINLTPLTPERFQQGNQKGVEALQQCGITTSSLAG